MNLKYFKYYIILLSLVIGWIFWLFEAAIGALVFYDAPFIEVAFTNVPDKDIYIRAMVIVFFMVSSLIMSALIVKRKDAEKALEDEKEKLAVTLRSIGDGVIATDTEGVIIRMNKIAEDLTGWYAKEAIGRDSGEIFKLIDKINHFPIENPVSTVLKEDRITAGSINVCLKTLDGTEKTIIFNAAPIREHKKVILGVVVVFNDISDVWKQEEETLRKEKLEAIGILAGGIAHDFNNILTGILGNTNLAQLKAVDEEMISIIQDTEGMILQAKELTNQLLTFSKGGAPIKRKVDTADFIKATREASIDESNVTLTFDIEEDLWDLEFDPNQMKQVFRNLIKNAGQAMPEGGGVNVIARNVELNGTGLPLPSGKYVKFSVRDEGIGIPRKHLQKVFDPYFTTKHMGNGLGLASAYSVITKHEGFIDVESNLGIGSVFHIYLPILGEENVETQFIRNPPTKSTGSKRILIMDDEEIIRTIASRILEELGYEVDSAVNGEETMEKYIKAREEGNPFDVVIMDLSIPVGMGGKQAIKKLHEIDPLAYAIVSSGYSNDPVMSDYKEYGFSGCVSKPYEIEELECVLEEVISR